MIKRMLSLLLLASLAMSTTACGCRTGYIGPRGGVHGGGCWVR